jgi:hypothetical protein
VEDTSKNVLNSGKQYRRAFDAYLFVNGRLAELKREKGVKEDSKTFFS